MPQCNRVRRKGHERRYFQTSKLLPPQHLDQLVRLLQAELKPVDQFDSAFLGPLRRQFDPLLETPALERRLKHLQFVAGDRSALERKSMLHDHASTY